MVSFFFSLFPCWPFFILSIWKLKKNENCNYVASHRHHELSRINRDEHCVAQSLPKLSHKSLFFFWALSVPEMATFPSNNSDENRRWSIKSWISLVETSSSIKLLNFIYIRMHIQKYLHIHMQTGKVRVTHLPSWWVFTFRLDSLLWILLIALKYLSFMRWTAAQQLLLHMDKDTKQETVCCFPHDT